MFCMVVYVAVLLGSEAQVDITLGTHGADDGFLAVSRMPLVWSMNWQVLNVVQTYFR